MDELRTMLKKLYRDHDDQIIKEIKDYLKTIQKSENPQPNYEWYKYLNLYFIYPDSIRRRNMSSLESLTTFLPHIKKLGCTAVHILPFLESPMVDKGFDVSNYFKIRSDLGTMHDMRQLVKVARKNGLRLFMDLVFNHVSENHEWFKKAQLGDDYYREFFIHQKTKPDYKGKFHKQSAVWARYIVNGKRRDINVAFPEHTGDIAHWRQGKDGIWYYHTYYPEQIDINWRNPNVFIEYAKVVRTTPRTKSPRVL